MKFTRSLPLLAFASLSLLALSGCQAPAPVVKSDAMVGNAVCSLSQADYQHVFNGHCNNGFVAKSQFLPATCSPGRTTQQNMDAIQQYCNTVRNAPNNNPYNQPDGRIRYDVNLGHIIGTAPNNGPQVKCGRLILRADGSIVTAFPEPDTNLPNGAQLAGC